MYDSQQGEQRAYIRATGEECTVRVEWAGCRYERAGSRRVGGRWPMTILGFIAPSEWDDDSSLPEGRPEWQLQASCRSVADPSIFFPDKGESLAPARAVCDFCPVSEQCLEHALSRHEFGVWAGTSDRERRAIRRRRKLAAQRKVG